MAKCKAWAVKGRPSQPNWWCWGLGRDPRRKLALQAGIPVGDTGAIAVDRRQRTEIEGIWSAGDCAQALHRVTGRPVNYHLGTIANKAGRVAGINIGGGHAEFPGVLGTAITKVCDLEIASTGLTSAAAREAGYQTVIGDAEGTTTAGYWPAAAPMAIRVIAEAATNRILGAQIVGGPGARETHRRVRHCHLERDDRSRVGLDRPCLRSAFFRSVGSDPYRRPPRDLLTS